MTVSLISIFIFGLFIGSFLNVLIDRLPRGEQVFGGRSHCDNCGHDLGLPDLIPLISFIFLRGKCRFCHSPIPWQNPLVELITGVFFAAVYYLLTLEAADAIGFFITPSSWSSLTTPSGSEYLIFQLIYWWIIVSGLIVIFFADFKYRIIPDAVLLPITALVILKLSIEWLSTGKPPVIFLATGAISLLGFLALVMVTKGKGMGLGDVKFAGVLGLLLGYRPALVAFYTAFLIGAITGIILIIAGKRRLGEPIPFGPFLVLGTFVSLVFGEQLLMMWYKLFV